MLKNIVKNPEVDYPKLITLLEKKVKEYTVEHKTSEEEKNTFP